MEITHVDSIHASVISKTIQILDIKIHQLDDELYKNKSFVSAKDIHIGVYDDPELRSIAFFHEVGHILSSEGFPYEVAYSKPICELHAWDLGLRWAYAHGVRYSGNALRYAFKELSSYSDY